MMLLWLRTWRCLGCQGLPRPSGSHAGRYPHVRACPRLVPHHHRGLCPLFLVSGEWGQLCAGAAAGGDRGHLSLVVGMFLILPGHMKQASKSREQGDSPSPAAGISWPGSARRLTRAYGFATRVFVPAVRLAVSYRYVTLIVGILTMISAYLLLLSGRIEQRFNPDVEFNNLFASFQMTNQMRS